MAFLDETGLAELWAQTRAADVKIATGSYIGTGTIGPSNPNSLTFDFAPRMLVLFISDQQYDGGGDTGSAHGYLLVSENMATVHSYGTYKSDTSTNVQRGIVPVYFTFGGNAASWYAPVTLENNTNLKYQPDCQANTSGQEYQYIAIG